MTQAKQSASDHTTARRRDRRSRRDTGRRAGRWSGVAEVPEEWSLVDLERRILEAETAHLRGNISHALGQGGLLSAGRELCRDPNCGVPGDTWDQRYGHWLKSAKFSERLSQRTAHNYRRLSETFGHLPVSVIERIGRSNCYDLAGQSEYVRKSIIRQAKRGTRFSASACDQAVRVAQDKRHAATVRKEQSAETSAALAKEAQEGSPGAPERSADTAHPDVDSQVPPSGASPSATVEPEGDTLPVGAEPAGGNDVPRTDEDAKKDESGEGIEPESDEGGTQDTDQQAEDDDWIVDDAIEATIEAGEKLPTAFTRYLAFGLIGFTFDDHVAQSVLARGRVGTAQDIADAIEWADLWDLVLKFAPARKGRAEKEPEA